MNYEFRPSFLHSLKKKHVSLQVKAKASIESIVAYLDKREPLRPGLGLKNFRKDYWEIRLDIRERIIFQLSDRIIFWLVGNHDEIRRLVNLRPSKR